MRARAIVCLVTLGGLPIPANAQAPAPPGGVRVQGGGPAGRAARAQVPQPQSPQVTLGVNKNDLYVNEVVTVTLNPVDYVMRSPFVFTIDFGDGEEFKGAQIAQVQHVYRAASSYTISASISIPSGAEIFVAMPVVENKVDVNVRTTTFSATPGLAAVGEQVIFATPVRPGDARIRYRFTFDDDEDSGWITDPQTTHAYKSARTYNPTMEVGLYDDNEYRAMDKAAPVSLQVADVTLEAPTSIRSDETATFTVGFPAGDPTLRYRVNFDDGSDPSAWDISPTATHAYAGGTYRPFGEIGRASDAGITPVAASELAELVVAQVSTIPGQAGTRARVGGGGAGGGGGGTIDWLPYVALALVTSLFGYGVRQLLVVPKPTFTLHRGQTDSQVDTAHGVTVQLEVRLHRNIDDVLSTLATSSGRLITDSRRRL